MLLPYLVQFHFRPKSDISIQIWNWKWAKCFNNWTKVEAYKEMYPREKLAANFTFQERDLIVIICFHSEILTKRPLSKGFKTNLSGFSLFFFALEAILKVY